MGGIGIVNNPRARRNRARPEIAARLGRLLDGEGELLDASTADELARALDRFAARGVDVLAVNGGDGTAHVVLSALVERWGAQRVPRILLLPGGAMNTVPRSLAVRGTPEAVLARHLDRRRAALPSRVVERDLLQVEAAGVPPRLGFIFGTGAVVAFLDAYYRTGWPVPATAAALLARLVSSALARGRFAARIAAREPLRVWADGEEWPDDRYLSVLAATVPEIGFGFRAFSRFAEQPGFFHAVGVTGSARRLAARVGSIYAGRPWSRTVALDAVARDLLLEAPGPLRFTVDGDLYRAEGAVRVRTGPPVRLVVD
jgi:hypothetical protein